MTLQKISIDPIRLSRILVLIMLVLLLINVALELTVIFTGHKSIFGLVKLFDFDEESSIPTLYNTILLLFASLILFLIYRIEKEQNTRNRLFWIILAIGFLFMGIDESVSIHELSIGPIQRLLGSKDLGMFYFAWVIPAIGLIVILTPFLIKFVTRLPKKTRLFFIIAAFLYLSGSIGIELIGGRHTELYGQEDIKYYIIVTIEEILELSGLIIFNFGLLDYIRNNFKALEFEFK